MLVRDQFYYISLEIAKKTFANTDYWAGPVCHSTESLFGYYYVYEHNSLGSPGNLTYSTFIRRGLPVYIISVKSKLLLVSTPQIARIDVTSFYKLHKSRRIILHCIQN